MVRMIRVIIYLYFIIYLAENTIIRIITVNIY